MPEDSENPRVGRKAVFFFILGIVVALFLPVVGLVAFFFLALAWIILVLLWVTTGMQTRRYLLYILSYTIGFFLILFLRGFTFLGAFRFG